MFTKEDLSQIKEHGLDVSVVEKQLDNFRDGFPYLDIVSAAAVGDGIVNFQGQALKEYGAVYEEYAKSGKVLKFVPASGAATRMFKDLFEFMLTGTANKVSETVLSKLEHFAFAEELSKYLPEQAADSDIISAIISGSGLNYGSQPKALILFHKYAEEARTAVEEHLAEGAKYASCDGRVNIHFTVSPEHRQGFVELLDRVLPVYEERFGVKYDVTMSEQKSSTDTIAVNPDNTPFRNQDGSLLFRPAGHGALLENLNDIDADIIFIKNIDNVTTESRRGDTIEYKKALAGILVSLQQRVAAILNLQDEQKLLHENYLGDVHAFIENELCVKLPASVSELPASERWSIYRGVLDRPIRVCGMVRNEGEPGGGPFWARNDDGTVSLQVVEPSQIAPKDAGLMSKSTHFNPVDLVCGVKDYKGRKYDLAKYVDPATGFISEKSKDGKSLLAQELPGLWNGSMSRWNTIFVEVPVSTFTPVKVVTDLLRPQHQEN